MFNGHKVGAVGCVSSGGTESIMLAVLAHREWGKIKGITSPNIILPSTAHPAFNKVSS